MTTQSAPPELTDGFHVFVDALKLNGVDTIYGLVGIPITDLARLAQNQGSTSSVSAMRPPPATLRLPPGSSPAGPASA